MEKLVQRDLMRAVVALWLGIGLTLAAAIAWPHRLPGVHHQGAFLPLLDLFQITAACAAFIAMFGIYASDHETLDSVDGPWEQRLLKSMVWIIAMATGLLIFAALYHNGETSAWRAEMLLGACLHTIGVSAAAMLAALLAFYPLRRRARLVLSEEKNLPHRR